MKEDVPGTVRKRYIVSGQVQDVAYRTVVKQKARQKGLVGVTRNLPDGTVEIVCEGDPEAIDGFLKAISIKIENPTPLDIDVASIVESPPPSSGTYKSFEIDYGKKLSFVEKSTKDREELTVLGASMLRAEVGAVGKDVRQVSIDVREVGQKVDGVGKAVENVGQKVDGVGMAVKEMHSDVRTRFDHMADRYDMIAISLKEAIAHMDRNAEKTDRAIEKSRKETVLAVRKSQKETARILAKNHKETTAELSAARKDFAASNRELAGAVKFMIRKLSDKPVRKRPAGKRKR
jgi:acylphosphatase